MHRDNKIKLLFILPAVIWVLGFTIFPFFYGFRLSFFNVVVGKPDEFVGFANYLRFFTDKQAINSLVITVIFVGCGVTVEVILGMLIALLFNRPMPGRAILRTLMMMPLFATPIAIGLLFFTIFYEEGGLINGLLHLKIPWLSDAFWSMVSIIIIDIWQWTPFCYLIFLAALQDIPNDVYEAAMLETGNKLQILRFVTLPMIQPMIVLVILLRITESFKVFDIVYTLTGGGPGTATQVLTLYTFRAGMRYFDFGYASTISFILFILVMIFVLLMFKRIRQIYQ